MRHEYDDGGRAAAGFKGRAGDCVCRALAIATERPYREVYAALNTATRKIRVAGGRASARTGIPIPVIRRLMAEWGWRWVPTMRMGSGCTVHLRDGELPAGRLVVAVSGHYVAVIDGVIRDTHDPSRGGSRCVYGYFTRAAR